MDGKWDAIVIGAGHNGLAAARVLAQRGRRVLVLEKNRYAGGMAGTREIFPGCRNEVGASALFPIAPEVLDFLQFERHGVEFNNRWTPVPWRPCCAGSCRTCCATTGPPRSRASRNSRSSSPTPRA